MKKKIWFLVLFLLLCCLLFVVYCFFQLNVYKLSPQLCKFSLAVSPEEFCDNCGSGSPLQNGYTFAMQDKEGNLILILNDKEVAAWKNSSPTYRMFALMVEEDLGVEKIEPADSLQEHLFEYLETSGLEISPDYTRIIETPDDNFFVAESLP